MKRWVKVLVWIILVSTAIGSSAQAVSSLCFSLDPFYHIQLSIMAHLRARHCEERSDEAIQFSPAERA